MGLRDAQMAGETLFLVCLCLWKRLAFDSEIFHELTYRPILTHFAFDPEFSPTLGASALKNVGLFSRLFLLLVLSLCFTIKIFTL